jgi:hypothetical protein
MVEKEKLKEIVVDGLRSLSRLIRRRHEIKIGNSEFAFYVGPDIAPSTMLKRATRQTMQKNRYRHKALYNVSADYVYLPIPKNSEFHKTKEISNVLAYKLEEDARLVGTTVLKINYPIHIGWETLIDYYKDESTNS